jgi:hypothetical protein
MWMMAISQGASFGGLGSVGSDRVEALKRLDALAQLMDNAFVIPGLNRRVGLDAVIGLVPGIGDAVTTLIQGYVIWEARRLGAPKTLIARMIGNVALDGLVGLIPFAGDAFDAVFKANIRNVKLLRDHLARTEPALVREASPAGEGGVIDAEYRVIRGGQ